VRPFNFPTNIKYPIMNTEHQSYRHLGYSVLDIGYWLLVIGYFQQHLASPKISIVLFSRYTVVTISVFVVIDIRCGLLTFLRISNNEHPTSKLPPPRIFSVGYWILDIGYWMLAIFNSISRVQRSRLFFLVATRYSRYLYLL
jgi:hypothetical protein